MNEWEDEMKQCTYCVAIEEELGVELKVSSGSDEVWEKCSARKCQFHGSI